MVVIVVLYAIFTQNSDSFILCINCEHRNKQETGNGGLYIPSLTTNNAMLMILTVICGVKLDSLRTLTEFGWKFVQTIFSSNIFLQVRLLRDTSMYYLMISITEFNMNLFRMFHLEACCLLNDTKYSSHASMEYFFKTSVWTGSGILHTKGILYIQIYVVRVEELMAPLQMKMFQKLYWCFVFREIWNWWRVHATMSSTTIHRSFVTLAIRCLSSFHLHHSIACVVRLILFWRVSEIHPNHVRSIQSSVRRKLRLSWQSNRPRTIRFHLCRCRALSSFSQPNSHGNGHQVDVPGSINSMATYLWVISMVNHLHCMLES